MDKQLKMNTLQSIKGIGPQREKQLHKLGIYTVRQLVEYFPRTYEDRSVECKISDIKAGAFVSVHGKVHRTLEKRIRPRLSILEVLLQDETGMITLTFFNQGYKKNFYKPGVYLHVYGKAEFSYGKLQMNTPSVETLREGEVPERGILPIYPLVEGIKQTTVRQSIKQALQMISQDKELARYVLPEVVPEAIRNQRSLMSRLAAVQAFHYPKNIEEYENARYTLAFEELFVMQAGLLMIRNRFNNHEQGLPFTKNGTLLDQFCANLSFTLTNDQESVFKEICTDLETASVPMQRLVQGDVGSGKTVVAAMALLKAVESGYQGVMMAPTEILAMQHFEELKKFYRDLPVKVALLTGSTKTKERRLMDEALQDGSIQILVGTHALIQDTVVFKNLGLAVIDEQHRFGVKQRALLQEKGKSIHLLIMTATPIPRTMALSVYGDLDISAIKEMPPGRKPVKTYGVDSSYKERLLHFFEKEMDRGRQVYVVCPLVEESEKLDLQAAEDLYEELKMYYEGRFNIALLHGRMSAAEKDIIMERFQQGIYNLLISTTVIEVGVNVPNATIMCIMSAERFGLSQLHQLRGRVGRGSEQSYCILVSDSRSDDAQKRIKLMESTSDGFVLAEEDLLMRGAGQLFGNAQHGLPDLKVANIIRDVTILASARKDALHYILENGLEIVAQEMKDHLKERFGHDFINILYS